MFVGAMTKKELQDNKLKASIAICFSFRESPRRRRDSSIPVTTTALLAFEQMDSSILTSTQLKLMHILQRMGI
jgi:hypothetical protein